MNTELQALAQHLPPITLEEMSGIKLMNRTDTKFVATIAQLHKFLVSVQGKYFIQEIDGIRIASYRTTYLDTKESEMYLMHHNGRSPREKIRVRTYLDSDLTFLEVKNKNNHGRTNKKRITVQSLENLKSEVSTITPFLGKYAWYSLDNLMPVIQNRFSRITLVNMNKSERLTIDFDLTFYNLKTENTKCLNQVVILELKRDGNVNSPALDIFRDLHIRQSGFSKYCIGCALTNADLKQNNFKSRLRFINKLEINI